MREKEDIIRENNLLQNIIAHPAGDFTNKL